MALDRLLLGQQLRPGLDVLSVTLSTASGDGSFIDGMSAALAQPRAARLQRARRAAMLDDHARRRRSRTGPCPSHEQAGEGTSDEVTRERDLPLPDYDHLHVGSLTSRIRTLDAADLKTLLAYERAHANRFQVVTACRTG